MSNNKQSSVRWAIEELVRFELGTSEFFSKTAIINHADRLHKEEIINSMSVAFNDGLNIGAINYTSPYIDWKQYYNETYGGGEQ